MIKPDNEKRLPPFNLHSDLQGSRQPFSYFGCRPDSSTTTEGTLDYNVFPPSRPRARLTEPFSAFTAAGTTQTTWLFGG